MSALRVQNGPVDTRSAAPGDLGGPVINGLELRDALQGTFKDIDESKRQVLVEFPHETVDSYKTKFGTRAFESSFAQRLPTMCWQHDLRDPIGHALDANITPRVNEIRGQFSDFDAVPNARRAFTQINDGTLTDFSFGFKNAHYEPGGQRGVRRITSAYMAEFSPVTIGSIPGAKAVGLREDGTDVAQYELGEILHMRDSGLLTVEGFDHLITENFPELREHLVVNTRDTSGTGGDGSGDDNDTNTSMRWTATDAGLHTATGPNGEALAVHPSGDAHVWSVVDSDGKSLGSGKEANVTDAKAAAKDTVSPTKRFDPELFLRDDEPITADLIRSYIEESFPALGVMIRDAAITIEPHIGTATTDGGTDNSYASSIAASVDAALDSAVQWLDGTDIASLPDNVQQSVALVQAAATAAALLLESMGISDPDGEARDGDSTGDSTTPREDDEDLEQRAVDAGFSTKPWGDISQSDYSPAQWKAATLIDTGEGDPDSKDRYALPVNEPDGTPNVHGIAAAASRLDQVDAPDAKKSDAAKKLMGLYGKMKKPVPPQVLKHAGKRSDEEEVDTRSDEEEAARIAEVKAKLDRRLGKR